MEDLQRKHRQETRDLQSRIAQKKSSATKKTRKGVNDECANLERDLNERQATETARLNEKTSSGHEDGETKIEDQAQFPSVSGDLEASEILQEQSPIQTLGAQVRKKPNRQKARLARRAAEQEAAAEEAAKEAEKLPDLRQRELKEMHEAAGARSLQEHDITPDGHCLYASIADQLRIKGIDWQSSRYASSVPHATALPLPRYRAIRYVTASYMAAHPDEFSPFLEKPLEQHLHDVRDTGEWGGHPELIALARSYLLRIKVLHANGRVDDIQGCDTDQNESAPCLWLAYYQHSYGLGEHYNSLRCRES